MYDNDAGNKFLAAQFLTAEGRNVLWSRITTSRETWKKYLGNFHI